MVTCGKNKSMWSFMSILYTFLYYYSLLHQVSIDVVSRLSHFCFKVLGQKLNQSVFKILDISIFDIKFMTFSEFCASTEGCDQALFIPSQGNPSSANNYLAY